MKGARGLLLALLGSTFLSSAIVSQSNADVLMTPEGAAESYAAWSMQQIFSLQATFGFHFGEATLNSAASWDTGFEGLDGSMNARLRLGHVDTPIFGGVAPSLNLGVNAYFRNSDPNDPVVGFGDEGLFSEGVEGSLYLVAPEGMLGAYASKNAQEDSFYATFGAFGRMYTDKLGDTNIDMRIGGLAGKHDVFGFSSLVGISTFPTDEIKLGAHFAYNSFEGELSPGVDVEVDSWHFGTHAFWRPRRSPFAFGGNLLYAEAEATTQFNSFDEEVFYGGLSVSYFFGIPGDRSYRDIDRYDTPNLNSAIGNLEGMPISGETGLQLRAEQMLFSDVRLKRDIRLLARLSNGLGIYRYRYLWSDREHVGVMAQEMLRIMPQAVRRIGRWLAVDYAQISRAPLLQRELRALGIVAGG